MNRAPPTVRIGPAGESGMAVNVRGESPDQMLLLPPSVREWLPEDHLAFFVLDVVAELDLGEFWLLIVRTVAVGRCMTRR